MKLTKTKLKQLIQEELKAVLNEQEVGGVRFYMVGSDGKKQYFTKCISKEEAGDLENPNYNFLRRRGAKLEACTYEV